MNSPHDQGGDVAALDDDGQVLDSLVTSVAEPPEGVLLPRARVDNMERVAPERLTRLVTRTVSMIAGQSYQIAGEDSRRVSVVISAPSGAEATVVQVGATAGDLASPVTRAVFAIPAIGGTVELSHTGQIWAAVPNDSTISVTLTSKDGPNA